MAKQPERGGGVADDRGTPRGRFFNEWWLSCGVCGREEPMGEENNRKALQEGRDRGWRFKRRYGWVCPEDAARLDGSADGSDGEEGG